MKIAFLSQPFDLVLPPEQTSIGLWTYEVARRLARRHKITILARGARGAPPHEVGEWGQLEWLRSAPLRLWSQSSRVWSAVTPASAPLFAQSIYALDYRAAAVRRLAKDAPDVIHIQNFPHFAPALRRAFPHAAIVLHMHCDWLVELDRDALARSLAAIDTVVGCSAHVAKAAEARLGTPSIRFATVANGAPPVPAAAAAADDRRTSGRVIFVGRVSPEKGLHTLLAAWPEIVRAVPHASLEIVGPPGVTPREFLVDLSSDPAVRALARFYPRGRNANTAFVAALHGLVPPDLAHTVSFVGHEPHGRVLERMRAAAVLTNPSFSESFGMSLVEALSVDTPVVATRVGGMPEILGATGGGLLVDKDRPGALAAAIVELLSDPARAATLARRGGQRARELFAWDRVAGLTEEVHAEALRRRRSPLAHASGGEAQGKLLDGEQTP